jgi:hypothetical protein
MTARITFIAGAAVAAALALGVLLLTARGDSPHVGRPTPGAVPVSMPVKAGRGSAVKVVRTHGEVRASYSGRSTAAPKVKDVPRARASAVSAAFAVLSRPQTAQEHSDFDIQQLHVDDPTTEIDKARALDAAHRVWLVPTTDGMLCIGMKTPGEATTFVHACGPAANAMTGGIAMTHGDGKLALLPDDAHSGQVRARGAQADVSRDVSSNYVWLPQGGSITFADRTGTHTL